MNDWPPPTAERFGVPWAHLYASFGREVLAYRMISNRRVPCGRGRLLQTLTGKKGAFARILMTRVIEDGETERFVKTVRLVAGNNQIMVEAME